MRSVYRSFSSSITFCVNRSHLDAKEPLYQTSMSATGPFHAVRNVFSVCMTKTPLVSGYYVYENSPV